MARKLIDGRWALDRDGVAELTGKAKATVNHWAINRNDTGYPQRCNPGTSGAEWVWEDEAQQFWETHQQAKEDALTPVDRSGNPDDMVTAPQVFRILGYDKTRKLPQWLVEHPDETKDLPSGRKRRLWLRKTVWHWADEIRVADPATGRPAGTGAKAPHWYANDPRLDQVIAMLEKAEADSEHGDTRGLGLAVARALGISEVTAHRMLTAARQSRHTPT